MTAAGAMPVRAEDAFDADAVAQWLRAKTAHHDQFTGTPQVRQFAGGVSNLTYLLSFPGRDVILRRPPAGQKAKGAHDMGREYRIQSQLAPVFPYVPKMIAYCDDESVIGTTFYLMQRVEGLIPRRELPGEMRLSPAQVRALCTNAIDLLIDLHSVEPAAAGLADLGKGEGYVARQISGWSQRYRQAKTWNVGSFAKVMAWLAANQPPDRAIRLIHNDFRFDNIVFAAEDPTRPVGLLDWELATLGDPLMDLGSSLAYWVQADDGRLFSRMRRQPTQVPGMLTRAEVVGYYSDRTGITIAPGEWAFYEVYGLFRLAVICQQIYYRYHHKQTTNPAFRHFYIATNTLEMRCRNIIRRHQA